MIDENVSVFKCPKCGKTTGGNEKFCIECGQALDIICPECSEKWRFMFDYKFCPNCGNSMKPPVVKKTEQPVHKEKKYKETN